MIHNNKISNTYMINKKHHSVSLRSNTDLSLDTKKPLMSHCFVDVDVKCATPTLMSCHKFFPLLATIRY